MHLLSRQLASNTRSNQHHFILTLSALSLPLPSSSSASTSSSSSKLMSSPLSRLDAFFSTSTSSSSTSHTFHNKPLFYPSYPSNVRIFEVGPRDGLQNEKSIVPLEVKAELIRKLVQAGLTHIEVGSFVSPKWVPQMANTTELFDLIKDLNTPSRNLTLSALTPNLQGLESALRAGAMEVAIFGAASESFSKKNINATIEESINKFADVTKAAIEKGVKVRGYVSCVLGCPYEGAVDPLKVVEVAQRMFELGCYEVSLGDTIGAGNPLSTERLLRAILSSPLHRDGSGGLIPRERIAVHFHDTQGTALANILVAISYGISVIDSSISGLGGCPYATGASGNVATEDVVQMLHGMGISTGVDYEKLLEASAFIDQMLSRRSCSKAAIAAQGTASRRKQQPSK